MIKWLLIALAVLALVFFIVPNLSLGATAGGRRIVVSLGTPTIVKSDLPQEDPEAYAR